MRIAMVSEHASPLAALGGVDAGGQNVHVAALAEAVARRGAQVLVLAATAAPEAVPAGAGLVTTDVDALAAAATALVADPALARAQGEVARAAALERFGLARFLSDWDRLLEEVGR